MKTWCVKNDGSQRFKDTVIKYLKANYECWFSGNSPVFYGINKDNEADCDNYADEFDNNILTIDEF